MSDIINIIYSDDDFIQEFAERVEYISHNLEKFPEIGYPEPLLKDRSNLYRTYHINKRFDLIYYYEECRDIVHVADIWDTRRKPESLANRIK